MSDETVGKPVSTGDEHATEHEPPPAQSLTRVRGAALSVLWWAEGEGPEAREVVAGAHADHEDRAARA